MWITPHLPNRKIAQMRRVFFEELGKTMIFYSVLFFIVLRLFETKMHPVRTPRQRYDFRHNNLSKYSLCENYFHTTGQSDWYLLNFNLSWVVFTCHIIEHRAKFDKSYSSLCQVNPKFLPVAYTFWRQMRFRLDWHCWYHIKMNRCSFCWPQIWE